MASRRNRAGVHQETESLTIVSGQLGPLAPCELAIRPLTVLVGRQGTGKSLVAQLLYFFRGLPDLVHYDLATMPGDEAPDPVRIIRRLVDGMRSSHRSFASLTKPNVTVEWKGPLSVGSIHSQQWTLGLNAQYSTRQIQPRAPLRDLVGRLTKARSQPLLTALFVPTERLFYSIAMGPTSLSVLRAPLVLQVFAKWMEVAGNIQTEWRGAPDTEEGGWIRQYLRRALAGEAQRRGTQWKWEFPDAGARRTIDLDMASSGQRANWALQLLPQVLFSLRVRGELATPFTLYVEEPEIHLHPSAERAIVDVLSFLVNRGLRVVITTHSLTVLYALNNLLMSSRIATDKLEGEIDPQIRLQPELVAAYHFDQAGQVQQLHDPERGLIDEQALGSVADDLAAQMNRIYAVTTPTE